MAPYAYDRVAAGVVTYHPDLERLGECLGSVAPQVEQIFVFDNASDDLGGVRAAVGAHANARLIAESDTNQGMACALNSLAAYAIALGYDALLLMDQDSVAADNLVDKESAHLNPVVGLVSPLIIDRNEEEQPEFSDRVHTVPRVISSGSLVNLHAFEAIGGCDERLFVDWVDFELCDHFKDEGYQLLCTEDTALYHEIGKKERAATLLVRDGKGGWKKQSYYRTNHSAQRRYDKARSQAITIQKYDQESPIGRDEYYIFCKEASKGALLERHRVSFVRQTMRGYRDGKKVAQQSAWDCHPLPPDELGRRLFQTVRCYHANKGLQWRFAVVGHQPLDDLYVLAVGADACDRTDGSDFSTRSADASVDGLSREIPADFVDVGYIDGQRWVSCWLADGLSDFAVCSGPDVVCRIMPHRREALELCRDLMMVNPGIDQGNYGPRVAADNAAAQGAQAGTAEDAGPLMSLVIPLYHTPERYLRAVLDSVLAQTYGRWELILANATPDDTAMRQVLTGYADPRVVVVDLPENLGIAGNTNQGIAAARGDYVGFLDHDDLLHRDALRAYTQAIAEHPGVGLLYSDEDNFCEDVADRFKPIFKPDLNLDLLYSHNYIVHFLMVSRAVLEKTARSAEDVSGAQDYDLTLKALEAGAEAVHVPQVLYHWRMHEGSTNGGQVGGKDYADQACVAVLSQHFERLGLSADIRRTQVPYHYRILFTPPAETRITLVLWVREDLSLEHLEDVFSPVASELCEVVLVTGAAACAGADVILTKASTLRAQGKICGLPLIFAGASDSLAGALEAALAAATGDCVLFADGTIVDLRPGTPRLLAGYASVPGVAMVSPKGFYVDGLSAYAGAVLDAEGRIRLINQNYEAAMGGGYQGMAECACAYSTLWPHCFLANPAILADALARRALPSAAPDAAMVDLCTAARSVGLRCVSIPDAVVTYRADAADDAVAFDQEATSDYEALWHAWGADLRRDVNFNAEVDYSSGYPRLLPMPGYVPPARPLYRRALSFAKRRIKRAIPRRP